jgi:hypothetical protein
MKALLLAAVAAAALHAQSGSTVEGRVTNNVTGEAVSGVSVRFLDRQQYVFSASTDSSGSYRISGLKEGDYTPEFSKSGFSDSMSNPRVHLAGDVPAQVNAQLKPWARLRGRVLDEDGKPAPGVRMDMGRSFLDDVSTKANGEFEFTEVAPGAYTLIAKPPPRIRVQDGVRLGTVAIYYPSATEIGGSIPIAVRSGQDVSGIEIRLKSVPVHRVAGVVLDGAGMPAPNATVKLLGPQGTARQFTGSSPLMHLYAANVGADGRITGTFSLPGSGAMLVTLGPGPEPEIAQVESHADGTFEFPAVESGDWRISAAIGIYEEMPRGGVASAAVGEKDVEDVQIRLSDPFVIESKADLAGEQTPSYIERVSNLVGFEPAEGQPRVAIRLEGDKRIPGVLPGRYRVVPGLGMRLDDLYMASVVWGGRDVLGQVVELAPGAEPFHILFKTGLGKLRGSVENGAGALVLLMALDTGGVSSVQSINCGADGSFELVDLVPGDYRIAVFDHGDQKQIPWTTLSSVAVPLASSVHIDSGATASMNLRASTWPW